MEVANTLDYNNMATITTVKSFTVQVYGQASNNSHYKMGRHHKVYASE
jgi:hypothetical protein